MYTIVVAYDKNYGIGLNGDLPWYFPEDLKHFKRTTMDNVVIYGSKTAETMPMLPMRLNVVMSRENKPVEWKGGGNRVYVDSPDKIPPLLFGNTKERFVIGGEQIFKLFLDSGLVETIISTEIDMDFRADRHFPIIPCEATGWIAQSESQLIGDIKDKTTGRWSQTHAKIVRYSKHE